MRSKNMGCLATIVTTLAFFAVALYYLIMWIYKGE